MHDQQIEELIAENLELKAENAQKEQDLRVLRFGARVLIEASVESIDPLMKIVARVVTEKFIKELSHK